MKRKNKNLMKFADVSQPSVYFFADFEDASLVAAPSSLGEPVSDQVKKLYDVPVFREGSFEHNWYGDLEFDINFLNKLVENFNKRVVPTDISFDQDHMPELGALAWIQPGGLYIKTSIVNTASGPRAMNILFARIELTPEGEEKLLTKRLFRYFSSEISQNYSTNELEAQADGSRAVKSWGPAIIGGGFTNRPFISHLGSAFNMFNTTAEEIEEEGLELSVAKSTVIDSNVNLAFGMMRFSRATPVVENKVEIPEADKQDGLSIEAPVADAQAPFEFKSQQTPYEEKTMKFSELLKLIKQAQSPQDRIELARKARFEDAEMEELRLHIISTEEANLEQAKVAEEMAREAAYERSRVVELSNANLELSKKVLEAGEQSYQHRVKAFSANLHQKGFTPALINSTEKLLLSIKTDERKFSFSVEANSLDLMGVLDLVFSNLPETYKVPEETDVIQTSPVNETSETEDPAPAPEPTEEEVLVQAFNARYGYLPSKEMVPFIRKDGSIDIGQLI